MRPADIHRRQTGVGGHADIVGFQIKYWPKGLRGAAGQNAESVFLFSSHGEDIGFAQPGFEIKIPAAERSQFEDSHVHTSEGIDSENPQILAGFVGQSGDALHQRCGGGDAFGFSHRCKNFLRQVAANFEMGTPSHEADRILEARERALVRHLDREKNRHPHRNAKDVERGKKRMRKSGADDLAPEQPQKPGGHSEVLTAALCRTCWRLRIAVREVILPPSRP